MIQDIGTHQFANEYTPVPPEPDSYLLCYRGREILMRQTSDGNLEFPRFRDLNQEGSRFYEEYIYLFSIDRERFYLGMNIAGALSGFTMENLEIFRTAEPQHLAFAGITGAQLYRWYKNHRFCGNCGEAMEPAQKERMLCCSACHNREYPKIMPAVIVGVTHGNRLLMSKYANRDFKRYALIAGFAEIGETLEETVHREVMEEVGLRVKNLRYYKSQPWSFSDTLLAGFFAELDGDEEITLDEEELAVAEWFEREEIPVTEKSRSLTNEMILGFKEGRIR